LRENERNFVDAYGSPVGPFKWLTNDQIKKVHLEIDKRMEELEATGLTREELLYDT